MTRRTLIVGCPIRRRHWILPTWRQYLDAELAANPDIEFEGFRFIAGPDDTRSLDVVGEWPEARTLLVDEPTHPDIREWTLHRYALMTGLRNAMLADVRTANPDLFLSLDSDMLLAPGALAGLLELLDAHPDCWAVGGKAYMVGGGIDTAAPSFGLWNGRAWTRHESSDALPVDIIMGIKLMDRRAYHVDYRYNRSGEDVGWSMAVREAGGRLWWDGRTVSKHVTDYPWLYLPDPRVGY